jgi:Tol biopolymer transport system component
MKRSGSFTKEIEMRRSWIVSAAFAAVAVALVIASVRTEHGSAARAARPSGKIAFVRGTGAGTQLFVMNADGTGQRQLTSGPDYDIQPDWSPDGRTIVYTHQSAPIARRIRSDIFAVNASGGGQRRLTTSPSRRASRPGRRMDARSRSSGTATST